MRALLMLELAAGASGLLTFVALLARRRWRATAEGRQLMVMGGYWAAIILMRLAAFLIPIPDWVFLVAWAPLGPVTWRWVVLLRRRR